MYCDLCIIGGGASGLVAGLSALEKGLEHVVILEKNEGVGKHSSQRIDLCVPDEQFKTIVDTLHIPINHISQLTRWISPSNIVYDFESRIPDYWIKRGSTDDALEPALLDMFLKAGGTILYHQKALTVQSSTNQVKTIIQKETEKTTVFSPAVIMADGGESEKNKNQRIPIIANGFYGENFDIPPGLSLIHI